MPAHARTPPPAFFDKTLAIQILQCTFQADVKNVVRFLGFAETRTDIYLALEVGWQVSLVKVLILSAIHNY